MTKEDLDLKLSNFFDGIWRQDSEGIPCFRMYVGGSWVESSSRELFAVDTPINGKSIAKVPAATNEDVKRAVDSAYSNKERIREIPGIDRIQIFRRAEQILWEHKDEFVRMLMLEAGKTQSDAEGEVKATLERLHLTLEEARKIYGEYIPGDWSEGTSGKFALVIREPIGVVGAITPFNYPLYTASAKIIPALLSGNAVVVKGSSEDPISLLLFTKVLEEAGLPKGVLNTITGVGAVGEYLVKDERVGMISFTGSTAVGKRIASLAQLKHLHLELGGKGLAVVLDDADLKHAAKCCVEGALKNSGQRCDAISVIAVQKNVHSEFVKLVLDEVKYWVVGDPRIPETRIGPLINRSAVERVHSLVEDAVKRGAKILAGGGFNGCFYQPTVLDDVPLDAKIVWEETFGPVVTIIEVVNEDEALTLASKSRYGLDACVFTKNFYRMWKVAKGLEVGEVTINDLPRHGVGYFPFGGWKESGIGREGIGYSIDEMTKLKTVVFNLEPAGLGKLKHLHPPRQ